MALKEEAFASIGDIFQQCIKQLGITEFPCGNGEKWRNNMKWDSDLLDSQKDISANFFSIEKLLELSYQKPFHKEIEWSSDAKLLIKGAIKRPDKVRLENIHRKFKSLRMVNRNIKNVDDYISKFENLEELILSANKIKFIKAKILPRGLRTLELSCNQLSDNMGCLCNLPPPNLLHIGLSHNGITTFTKFIQYPNRWESLLSLDLSYNNLENLFETVDILKKLPKLSNLHLIGNPLYLFIGYRGFVVDSLKTLSFLDEVNISAHERHLFKGVNKIKNLPTSDFCVIELKLDDFKGKIRSEPIDNDEVIRTFVKYHIELTFTKDCTVIDADELINSDGEEDNTIMIIPECNDIIDVDNTNKVIQSNEFNFLEEELVAKINKYIICNKLKEFTQLVSSKIEIRLIRTSITMSTEPIENELLPNPTIKDSNGVEKGAKKSSVAMKRKDSVKSNASAQKRTGTKLAKPKKPKVNVDDFYELTRTSELYASVEVDCQSVLNGTLVVQQDCLFEPQNIPPEKEPEILTTPPLADRSRKKASKSSKQSEKVNNTKTKVEPIIEEPNKEGEEGSQEIPEPPSLYFSLKIVQWNNSKTAFNWVQKFGSKVTRS